MGSRQPGAPVTGITIDRGRATANHWPYTLPVVRHIWQHGLTLNRGVTVLIGENGTGKSTVVEALAAAWGRRITAFREDWLQRAVAGAHRRAIAVPKPWGGLPRGAHRDGCGARLYIMDEPESALSFDSCLMLLQIMADMRSTGSQIVLATHSPILAAMPHATVLQLDADGINPVSYEHSDLVTSWRSFLQTPDRYLRHLT
ncbi:MAG: AAA family ATPase [Geodermatophilaceae bacterium]